MSNDQLSSAEYSGSGPFADASIARSMDEATTFEFKPTTNRIATIADTRCHVALFMNRDGSGELVISHPNREPHKIAVASPKDGWRVSLARYPTGEIEVLYTEDKAQ